MASHHASSGGTKQFWTQYKIPLIGLAIALLGASYFANRYETKVKNSKLAKNELYLAEKSLEDEMKKRLAQNVPTPQTTSGHEEAGLGKKGAKPSKNSPAAAHQKADLDPEADQAPALSYQILNVDREFPVTVGKLKTIEQSYAGTWAAFESRLRLAQLYSDHGDFAQASQWYESAAESAPSSFEKATSVSGLAYTLENLGKYKEAADTFQKALRLGESELKGDLLLGIARSYELAQDTAQARTTYDQILTELPNTDYAKSAEMFKSQLK